MFFKVLPNHDFVKVDENKTSRGVKQMKVEYSVTLFVCTNGDGSHKIPLSLIGTAKEPRCFRNKPLPLKKFRQTKAWCNVRDIQESFDCFLEQILSRTMGKVSLLMTVATLILCLDLEAIVRLRLSNCPPDTASMYQPMDTGIISMVK